MMTRTAIAVFAAAVAGPSGWAQVEPLDEAFEYEGNRPALGAWLGNVTLPGRDAAPAQVVIDREGDGPWSIAATLPPWRAVAEPCVDVTVHDRSVTFTLKARHQAATFRGTVSGDGQRLAGTVSVAGDGPGGVFELARTPRPDDLPEPMAFTGGLPSSDRPRAANHRRARRDSRRQLGRPPGFPGRRNREIPDHQHRQGR